MKERKMKKSQYEPPSNDIPKEYQEKAGRLAQAFMRLPPKPRNTQKKK